MAINCLFFDFLRVRAPGVPNFSIVGLPDAAVKESSDRVSRWPGNARPTKSRSKFAPALRWLKSVQELAVSFGFHLFHGNESE